MRFNILLFILIFSLINTYPQWINQNPVPNGNDLNSVFFIDDNTGWLVGSEGFIKKTTNAGLDWIQQNCNTALTLSSVQFINSNTGWVCGEGGLISKTTDGGLNWTQSSSTSSNNLTDICFCSNDTGYAVGYNGTILKTADAGSTWVSQNSDTTYDLYSVDFIDPFLGFAVGGRDSSIILKTTDGGINWSVKSGSYNQYPQSIIYEVKFINENKGFIGGGDWLGEFIFKTTDGGETWASSLREQLMQQDITFSKNGGINSFYFKDSNIGYAVGGYGNGWERKIYTTTNGGENWISKYYGFEEDGLLSVYGNNIGNGWAVGFRGAIFITEDNGNSWSQILSGDCSSAFSGDDIYHVFFIDGNVGWASGFRSGRSGSTSKSFILKTTDGGKIWKTQYLSGPGNPVSNKICLFSK